ncbi:MAG: bifunctional UDP-N-acetylglucosamine diphosphorylase/glucosamine-1-phosphate N-acetyltransferase GlmU [Defluviitaleaceae bacterium]|nr:bifunctional UDP-N-acetylglucosamine diphosphorylase/glucosamine-1-phosphate N-acetyltransferase GlmU [Defluviitaleaceae bacterium]
MKAIILAAGLSKRMKSEVPKFLHKIMGRTLVSMVADAARGAGADEIIAVIGQGGELVRAELGDSVSYAEQKEPLGTGDAVRAAQEYIGPEDDVLVLCGDTPLLTSGELKNLIDAHQSQDNALTLISVVLDDATGYGRVVQSGGVLEKIVEHKDASPEEREIKEIWAGVMAFKGEALLCALPLLKNENAAGEYYLTEAIEILRKAGRRAGVYQSPFPDQFIGINTRVQLAEAAAALQKSRNEAHMLAGVTMTAPSTVWIDSGVEIGQDTVLYPGVILEGSVKIGKNCEIGPNTRIVSSEIGDCVTISNSVVVQAKVGNYTSVGPFAYLRPNADIGEHCKVGDFVEVKNSVVGNGSKASHLAYIGDACVGEGVNFGCGAITANYDGKRKSRTVIEAGAFIGSNTNLVAPVTVGAGATVAAGSTITDDVPGGALAIARERQVIKEGWKRKE